MNSFDCLLPRHVSFGNGALQRLAGLTVGRTVLILSDPFLDGSGLLDKVVAVCRDGGATQVERFTELPAEPTEDQITQVVAALAHHAPDCLVALGGGSVMDMAKFVAVMLGDGPTMEDLFAGRLPATRKTTLIMLPTTAGTGAEATPNAIALRPRLNLKVGVVCPAFMPDEVILDPALTLGLPPAITAATGLDALCHALECFISKKANPISDIFAREATRLIFHSLKTCWSNGQDVNARGEMQLAAFYAGLCIAASGTTAVHALSYPLGGRYRIAHGVSNALLLAPVFRYQQQHCRTQFAELARLVGLVPTQSSGKDDDAKAAAIFVTALADLSRELGIPATLSELGVPADALQSLTEAAFEVKRLLDNNPMPLNKNDILAIYQQIV